MKKIYIVTTQTQTVVGQGIRTFTGKKYNHTSIAFDASLKETYGFGREVIHNPFSARLILEKFQKHPHYDGTDMIVSSIEVKDEEYAYVKAMIELMYLQYDQYKYNYAGFLGYIIGRPIRRPNHFNCSQFVGHVLASINIYIDDKDITDLMPLDFVESDLFTTEYEGPIDGYFEQEASGNIVIEQRNIQPTQ